MLNFFIHLLSNFIPVSKMRKNFRLKVKSLIYGRRVYKNATKVGKGFACAKGCFCGKNTIIGDNVRFNTNLRIYGDGGCIIGNNSQFGDDIMIITQNHNFNDGLKLPYDEAYVYKQVEIGENVWCGSRVIILPGTKIGEGVVIQAGAVVHGEIPPYSIIGGNPAKVFKTRDVEHYNKIKNDEMFLYNYL